MFGFVFGTLCLIAFISVLTRRRYAGFGCGRRWGHRRRFGLYGLFQELDTSPGQEKAIRSAIGEFRRTLDELLPRLDSARAEVASALREASFNPEKLEASIEGRSTELGQLTRAMSAALGKAHEALDPDQRRRLARFIEAGRGYCAA